MGESILCVATDGLTGLLPVSQKRQALCFYWFERLISIPECMVGKAAICIVFSLMSS